MLHFTVCAETLTPSADYAGVISTHHEKSINLRGGQHPETELIRSELDSGERFPHLALGKRTETEVRYRSKAE